MAVLPLIYQPGSVGEYSRAADVLGRVIAVISGQSLGVHLAQNLFEPLGQTPAPRSVDTHCWSGMGGTSFFVDPSRDLFALMLIEAPNQRAHYRQLFRNVVDVTLLN